MKEGGEGNRKFFCLMCHYIPDSKCYLNLLTDVTSPALHIPFV